MIMTPAPVSADTGRQRLWIQFPGTLAVLVTDGTLPGKGRAGECRARNKDNRHQGNKN